MRRPEEVQGLGQKGHRAQRNKDNARMMHQTPGKIRCTVMANDAKIRQPLSYGDQPWPSLDHSGITQTPIS